MQSIISDNSFSLIYNYFLSTAQLAASLWVEHFLYTHVMICVRLRRFFISRRSDACAQIPVLQYFIVVSLFVMYDGIMLCLLKDIQ